MRIKRFIKKIFFSSNLYDIYLKKNELQDIAFTPKDAWPGDPLLGDRLVQGYYSLGGKTIYSPDKTLWQITNSQNLPERNCHCL